MVYIKLTDCDRVPDTVILTILRYFVFLEKVYICTKAFG